MSLDLLEYFGLEIMMRVLLILCVTGRVGSNCDKSNITDRGHLSFTEEIGTADYARLGHYRELYCCATGFTKIEWSRYNETSNKWVEFPWFPHSTNYEDRSEIFEIHTAREVDKADYRCMVENQTSGMSIEHIQHLYLYHCDNMGGGPLFTDKKPRNLEVLEGTNVTFPCEGYFGCGQSGDRDVTWTYINEDGLEFRVTDIDKKRYSLKKYKSKDGLIGNELRIQDVKQSDFNIGLICTLATNIDSSMGMRNVTVMLTKKVPHRDNVLLAWGTLAGVVCLIVILAIIISYWKPQLEIWAKSRLGRLPQRGNKTNDVFIWYHYDDEYIAHDKLMPELKTKDMKIVQRCDIPPGIEIQNSSTILNDSAALIVIISERVSEEDMSIMNMFINAIGTDPERGWSRVTIIVYGNLRKKCSSLTNSKLLYRLRYPHEPTDAELAENNPLMQILLKSQVKKAKQDFFSNLLQRLPHKARPRIGACDEQVLLESPPASPRDFEIENEYTEEAEGSFDDQTYEKQLSSDWNDDQHRPQHSVHVNQIHDLHGARSDQQYRNSPHVYPQGQNANTGRLRSDYLPIGQVHSEHLPIGQVHSEHLPIAQPRMARGDSGIASLSPPDLSPPPDVGVSQLMV
ncbi:hypothetical protein ScPMuIL_015556 [Solemya velum]